MKFVSLHNHDGHSIYDAIGSPEDYADWMLENAGEESGALAITNHGNMNSIGYIAAAQKKYKDRVKFIYGVEAYYIPSVEDWKEEKQRHDLAKKEEKKKRKVEEDESELVIENETESKSKFYDPIDRRHHLIVLAKNQKGLENLYKLVSRSYRQGFYRKPRIDFKMLQDCNEGLIVSTACIAGIPTWCAFHPDIMKLDESQRFQKRMELLHKELDPFIDLFGERFFLELQFNSISEQNEVNILLFEFAKRVGINRLIATCDAHYPKLELWKDREIYKLLGYQMQKKNPDLSAMDKKFEDLDAQLYLKNGNQIWNSFLNSDTGKKISDTESQKIIFAAIRRTYDIAHDFIEDVYPDDTIKLPKTFQVTEDIKSAYDKLKNLTLQGLKEKNLLTKEYIDRAAYELGIIKKLGVEEYFLAKKEILDVLREYMLLGPARGSAGGSLVCYLIGITMIDPIKSGLLFERFMSTSRAELPDIDSDVELKDQVLDILKGHFGADNVLAISNYNRLQLRSLIKDISKLHNISFEEVYFDNFRISFQSEL